jgi:nucleoside-diphosphate-sugar epimerase
MAYHKEKALPITILRPFNIYGPHQTGEGAIRNFVLRALKNEALEIYGDGKQKRTWCYIDDMVNATLLALESPAASGEVFHIGNPYTDITIFDLARLVIHLLKSDSKIIFRPKYSADVDLRIPAIEKAKLILGYEPTVMLEDGILRTAISFRSLVN